MELAALERTSTVVPCFRFVGVADGGNIDVRGVIGVGDRHVVEVGGIGGRYDGVLSGLDVCCSFPNSTGLT